MRNDSYTNTKSLHFLSFYKELYEWALQSEFLCPWLDPTNIIWIFQDVGNLHLVFIIPSLLKASTKQQKSVHHNSLHQ